MIRGIFAGAAILCVSFFIDHAVADADEAAAKPDPTPSSAPTPPPACETAEFRQFDFWLGDWTVRNLAGKEIGSSEITPAAGACAIHESWKSANGITGSSINYYDREARQWQQHWVGSDGSVLHLEGSLKDGSMIMESESKTAGGSVANRIVWSRLPDDKVKQEWTASSDGGQTWTTSFVGIYERKVAPKSR